MRAQKNTSEKVTAAIRAMTSPRTLPPASPSQLHSTTPAMMQPAMTNCRKPGLWP